MSGLDPDNFYLRNFDPSRMSDEERREAFYQGILEVDLRNHLPTGIINVLVLGDDFSKAFPTTAEPLVIGVKRQVVGDMVDPGQAYHGAVDARLIEPGASYDDFRAREVVSVYSEFHGGHSFVYDAEIGMRFMPRGDVDHLDWGLGSKVAYLGSLLETLLLDQD